MATKLVVTLDQLREVVREELRAATAPLRWIEKYGEYMTRSQAAKEFRRDPSTIDRWIKAGILSATKDVGGLKLDTRKAYDFYRSKHPKGKDLLFQNHKS